jgi:hypothetical protein
MVDATERELDQAGAGSPAVVIADAGYWHKRQMENVIGRGIQVLIPPVRKGLARQRAGVGCAGRSVVAQPAVLELVEQRLGRRSEPTRVDRGLRVDGGRQLRRAVVCVDDSFDVPAELEPKPE